MSLLSLIGFFRKRYTYSHFKGGAVAQSVDRVTPGKEVLGSSPSLAARSLLVESVSV